MIRKFIDWVLYTLHIKKREHKSALEAIFDLLPYLFACMVVTSIINRLDLAPPTLWQVVLFRLRLGLRRWRMVIIGY